jgi:dTDP-4-dehydrorhamnose 3,5-epimerase
MNPGDEVFVPKDFAHGFITKEDNTVVQYLVDNEYRPDKEGCVYWGHFESVVMKVLTICKNIDNITISEKDKVNKNYEGIN